MGPVLSTDSTLARVLAVTLVAAIGGVLGLVQLSAPGGGPAAQVDRVAPVEAPSTAERIDQAPVEASTTAVASPVAGPVASPGTAGVARMRAEPRGARSFLRLSVRSVPGLTPLPGATVTATTTGGESVLLAESPTNEAGRVVVPRGPGLVYEITADGHSAATLVVAADERAAGLEVDLNRHAELSGIVELPPVNGARLGPFDVTSVSFQAIDPVTRVAAGAGEAMVEPDGSWSIGAVEVPHGLDSVEVVRVAVERRGATRRVAGPFTLVPGERRVVSDGWSDHPSLDVVLRYPNGVAPAKGLEVQLLAPRSSRAFERDERVVQVRTDGDGRARFGPTEPGSWRLLVLANHGRWVRYTQTPDGVLSLDDTSPDPTLPTSFETSIVHGAVGGPSVILEGFGRVAGHVRAPRDPLGWESRHVHLVAGQRLLHEAGPVAAGRFAIELVPAGRELRAYASSSYGGRPMVEEVAAFGVPVRAGAGDVVLTIEP